MERTGNGKEHNTTKKIPAKVFLEEKKHLRPAPTTNFIEPSKNSISRLVRKNNTILFKGNRYSLPPGTYDGSEKYVNIFHEENEDMLIISDIETGMEITGHPVSYEKGKLIKNRNHCRDHSKGIPKYMENVTELLGNTIKASDFLKSIYELKPRYIRDQLQLISTEAKNMDNIIIAKALDYCHENKLYSANDFKDVLMHFEETLKMQGSTQESIIEKDSNKTLDKKDIPNLKSRPQVRDAKVYQQIVSEEISWNS